MRTYVVLNAFEFFKKEFLFIKSKYVMKKMLTFLCMVYMYIRKRKLFIGIYLYSENLYMIVLLFACTF